MTALARAPAPRPQADRQLLLFGDARPRVAIPAEAPAKLTPPFHAARRTQTWRETSDRRGALVAKVVAQLSRLTDRAGAPAASPRGRRRRAGPGGAVDVASVLAEYQDASRAERLAWAEHAPDILGGAHPSRLRDAKVQQRPVGLVLDQDTGDLRTVSCSSLPRETLIGTVNRQAGGSYEAIVRVRVLGHGLSAVLERSRCIAELGG